MEFSHTLLCDHTDLSLVRHFGVCENFMPVPCTVGTVISEQCDTLLSRVKSQVALGR